MTIMIMIMVVMSILKTDKHNVYRIDSFVRGYNNIHHDRILDYHENCETGQKSSEQRYVQ